MNPNPTFNPPLVAQEQPMPSVHELQDDAREFVVLGGDWDSMCEAVEYVNDLMAGKPVPLVFGRPPID